MAAWRKCFPYWPLCAKSTLKSIALEVNGQANGKTTNTITKRVARIEAGSAEAEPLT